MFKKVTKQEYDVLSRYHPSEIRYYVDFSKVEKGKRVSKKNGAAHKAEEPTTRIRSENSKTNPTWAGKWKKNPLIALGRVSMGNLPANAAAGTLNEKARRGIAMVFNGNAFTQYRRDTLIQKVAEATSVPVEQIRPEISRLLAAKKLRVVQQDAQTPLS